MRVLVDTTVYAYAIPETTDRISVIWGFGVCTEILQASFIVMFLVCRLGINSALHETVIELNDFHGGDSSQFVHDVQSLYTTYKQIVHDGRAVCTRPSKLYPFSATFGAQHCMVLKLGHFGR